MKKKWLAVVAIVLLVGVPLGLKFSRSDPAKEVEIEKVTTRALSPSILASGTLSYESQVTLAAEVVGKVKEILVKEGDQVSRGQLLLRLDPESARADVAQLEASKRQAELHIQRQQVNSDSNITKWKRYESLRQQGMVDAAKFDEIVLQKDLAEVDLRTSREALRQTEAQLKQAQERLAKTEIRSPMAGKITTIAIKVGETAVPSATSIAGSSLMVIGDTTSLYAEINVDETDIAKVNTGQQAKIVPAAFPDKSLTGKVVQVAIAPRQNPGQSRQYPVKIRLEATPGVTFHPGMSCRSEISIKRPDGEASLAVPVQAVIYDEPEKKNDKPKASVFVMVDEKAVKREVETGIADDTHIEILKGLKRDEEAIIGPAKTLRFLRQDERVKPAKPSTDSSKTTSAAPK
ncbi:MAG: efflux RND transporter periplasmic adaptor subunit [Betaproteobacteria bacterium]|nr:efflux RND transporter periplasmic adaptor subunit [Betaproteobacteria bacterium]